MHKLTRQVRFSINPFLPEDIEGFNSYASRPAGEGLSLFFELSAELVGGVESATGFVVNIIEIDKSVRAFVVPIFGRRIREDFGRGKHIGLFDVAELLNSAWDQLADKFGAVRLSKLTLALNPFRKVAIDGEGSRMVYFSEKFEFAATHKLWNDEFTQEHNFEVFGKCANPTGHGHNYVVEVTVKVPKEGEKFCVGDFERTVNEELIKLLDHKNLNTDVPEFSNINPTVENIAAFAWEKIAGKFGEATLHSVTIWETDKTYCTYHSQ